MSNAKTVWTVPRQPAAVTAFKVTGVAISCGLFAILLAHRLCRYERDAEVCFGPSVVSVTLESLAPDFGGQVRRAYLSGPPEASLIAEPPSLGDHQCSIT